MENGATVIAIDIEGSHLASVQVSAKQHGIPSSRLRCIEGHVPEALSDMRSASISHVLASNVMHFLAPNEVTKTLKTLYRVMAPGSYLHIQVDSPYIRGLGIFYYFYIMRRLFGHAYPGYIALPDFVKPFVLPYYMQGMHVYHIFDAEILQNAVRNVGFEVLHAGYEAVDVELDQFGYAYDGREATVLVAKR